LPEQDRSHWDQEQITEGVALVTTALPKGAVGPYQLQAAIAAVHDEAPRAEDTDWTEILALYTVLEGITENPMVSLNRAIALAMVHGPAAGLERLDALDTDGRLAGHHRMHAVRAHLLELAGDRDGAIANYRTAANRTMSLPEQRYLVGRAARLAAQAQ
jgi:predicted RNA polymerase sigma factor